MPQLFMESPLLFIAVVFAFCLVIGSLLNVVIYRLPIMMERDWREQCEELAKAPREVDTPEAHFEFERPTYFSFRTPIEVEVYSDTLASLHDPRLMADMDRWGYSFRLGSARAWFEQDAGDALTWLQQHQLLENGRPGYRLRL